MILQLFSVSYQAQDAPPCTKLFKMQLKLTYTNRCIVI